MTIIHMRNVEGDPKARALDAPLPYIQQDGTWKEIEVGFTWDGSSVPRIFQGFFPRHRHPIASCRHDKRCEEATCKEDRAFADAQFKIDVATTSWRITSTLGYIGVRIGAFFGVGSNF